MGYRPGGACRGAQSVSLTTETRYTYEGLSLLSLAATETAGSSASTYTVTYLLDASGPPYAGLYASGEATAVSFVTVLADRGDIVELRDMSGAPFAAYRYDAWGTPLSTVSTGTASIDATRAAAIALRQPLGTQDTAGMSTRRTTISRQGPTIRPRASSCRGTPRRPTARRAHTSTAAGIRWGRWIPAGA